jgi:hypothetical protein
MAQIGDGDGILGMDLTGDGDGILGMEVDGMDIMAQDGVVTTTMAGVGTAIEEEM